MKTKIGYFTAFSALFICEIIIGAFFHDPFIRPYMGDVLVTALICCMFRIIFTKKPKLLPLYVFIFSVFVELLQLIHIADILNIQNRIIRIAVGNSFSFIDIVCYGVGCVIIALIEFLINRKRENRMIINVAIDGPAGAGKSTIAKECAKELGFIYVDTGALYRSIGLYVMNCGKDYSSSEDVISCLPSIDLSLKFADGTQRVILNGEDVSEKIRTPEVSMAASGVSPIPKVREYLLDLQRSMAKENSVIMDGRDIGTVILPNADVKIFLTASPEERANRRYTELIEKGEKVTFDEVLEDIIIRDKQDSTREIAPLKPAKDSVTVDTTGKTLDESVEIIINLINSRCNKNG